MAAVQRRRHDRRAAGHGPAVPVRHRVPVGLAAHLDHAYLLSLVRLPVTKLVLFGLCALALFHWAHRFRYTLHDGLQLERFSAVIILCCYGGAVMGSGVAGYLLLRA